MLCMIVIRAVGMKPWIWVPWVATDFKRFWTDPKGTFTSKLDSVLYTCWKSLYNSWTRNERLCIANNLALSECISLRCIIHSPLQFVQLVCHPFPAIQCTQRGVLGEGNEVLIAGYSKNDAKNATISTQKLVYLVVVIADPQLNML